MCSESIVEPGCGKCNRCVVNGQGGVLTDTLWREGMDRDELVSVEKCQKIAWEMTSRSDIKEPMMLCSKCFVGCPLRYGRLKSGAAMGIERFSHIYSGQAMAVFSIVLIVSSK